MAGAYGRHPEDRAMEDILFEYLDGQDEKERHFDSMVDKVRDGFREIDIHDAISEASPVPGLVKAIKNRDESEIGKIILDVVDGYAERVADRKS